MCDISSALCSLNIYMRSLMRGMLDGVPVFVEAVQAGGFSRAAERLALSRSAVGKTIARLEARLGVRLFQRTTSSLSLTEDGQVFYERCLRALEELRAAEALIESGRREVSGRLKISMPHIFGRHCAAPILLDLAQRHPALELDLRFSDSVVDVIGERFDLAIRNHTPGEGSGLSHRQIARQSKVVCASPAYVAKHGAPTRLDELPKHEALVYTRNDQVLGWALPNASGRLEDPVLKWRHQFDSMEAVADAAVRGAGIACLPGWLARGHLEAGRLVPVLVEVPGAWVDTYAVWPSAPYVPLRVSAVIEELVARVPEYTLGSTVTAGTVSVGSA